MKSALPVWLAGMMLAAASSSAEAGELYDKYFAKRGKACYARGYDAAHLAGHPRQKVRRIEMLFTAGPKSTLAAFVTRLGLQAKDARRFSSEAYCAEQGGGIVCKLESDGGTFRLVPARGNGLTLQVVGDGLRMEGSTFIEAGGAASDDNVFVLAAADPRQCRIAGSP